MFRSGLAKSACVAILISGFSAPPAGAIEMVQGSGPAADLNDGLISRVVVYHRGATAVGPRGGVYHRGGTWAATVATATAGATAITAGTATAATATVPMDTAARRRSAQRRSVQRLSHPIVGSTATEPKSAIKTAQTKQPAESPRRPVCGCGAIDQATFRLSAEDLPVFRSATRS